MNKLLFFIFLTLIEVSCSQKSHLSATDYNWMPYKGDETLVFVSNTGITDTIFIMKKDTIWGYPDAQSLVGLQCEVVRVFCRHTDSVIQNKTIRYLENNFCSIQKNKNNHAVLTINLLTRNVAFYRNGLIDLDSLNKQSPMILKTKQKQYNDVYIINSEDYLGSFHKRDNFVAKIYWSKSRGLIRYDKKNGIYWELVN